MRRLLIFTLLVLLLCSVASAVGRVSTVDIGYYNADEMKQAVSFKEKEWANGTYSNTRLEPGGVVTFDIRDHLTMSAAITLTPTNGAWKWYPANQTGNMVFYRNAFANVSYTAWDTILKEQIILAAPVSSISWQINLSVKPQTLTITTDGDDYLIKNPAYGDGWIRVRRPFVVDANGVKRTLRYTWNNGQRRLTLVQDFSGLTYPLTIDPTYTVDSTGVAGINPIMLVNASGVPQIVYGDGTNHKLKLATNVSGVWTTRIINSFYGVFSNYPSGVAISPVNDLPIATSSNGTTAESGNFTWSANGAWRMQNIYSHGVGNAVQIPGNAPIGQSSSGRVLYVFVNSSYYGDLNLTRIESTTGNTVTAFLSTILKAIRVRAISGEMNATGTLNFIWTPSTFGYGMNWTTVTDSSSPSVTTISIQSAVGMNQSNGQGMCMRINPQTGFPGVAYPPQGFPRQVNFTHYEDNRWKTEIAAVNVSGGMSWVKYVALGFNSSGTPYIAYNEKTSSADTVNGTILQLVYRISAGSWSMPVTIDQSTDYVQSTIAFDASDNLHVAYYKALPWSDLKYYFEALPAAGAAPVAAFACTPLAVVRNQTITCTDSSTNTPTSWDWYSPDAQQQVLFSGNITNQNPSFFPHYLGGYFSVNLIVTNAYGTSTKASGPRYIWVQKPWV